MKESDVAGSEGVIEDWAGQDGAESGEQDNSPSGLGDGLIDGVECGGGLDFFFDTVTAEVSAEEEGEG